MVGKPVNGDFLSQSLSKFTPPWWLRGPHGQTIFSHFANSLKPKQFYVERHELPDGDFLDIGSTPPTDGMIVCLFHGLEGTMNSSYILETASRLEQLGHQALCLNFRSCGAVNRLARAYHSGETGDIRYVINAAREKWPHRKIAAAGFSLGGNALLMYLSEEKEKSPLFAAAAISVPCDLSASCEHIHRPTARFYEVRFLKQLKKKLHQKAAILDEAGIDWRRATKAKSFRDFDELVTAPLHGFKGASDYYERASSIHRLTDIVCDTLLLQSDDDPMLGVGCYPQSNQVSSSITHMRTQFGGHVGWVTGSPWRSNSWMTDQILNFFECRF